MMEPLLTGRRRGPAAGRRASGRMRPGLVRPMPAWVARLALLLAAWPRASAARSLWSDGHDLPRDFRASQVGDQLTVLIVEIASGSGRAATKLEKQTDTSFKAGPGLGGLDFIPLIGLSGNWTSDHDGKGSTTRSNRVQAKITAEVSAVRPNGDLEIVGNRWVQVNGEKHRIRLSGVVRPRDISAQNTILSSFVGDARVEYSGAGIVTNGQQVGWWKRILDWIF